MQIRRAFLLATVIVLVWATPAYAQTYGGILEEGGEQGPGVGVTGGGVSAFAGEDLARTGQNNIVPLIQAAIVLLGAGILLVLVARRRRAVRRAAAA